jgi:hypothetical protein
VGGLKGELREGRAVLREEPLAEGGGGLLRGVVNGCEEPGAAARDVADERLCIRGREVALLRQLRDRLLVGDVAHLESALAQGEG